MSDDANNVELLESLKKQHQSFIQQRDNAQFQFQQLIGAVVACEMMIKDHEEKLKKKQLEEAEKAAKEQQLKLEAELLQAKMQEQQNGEVNEQGAGEAAQE